MSDYKLQKKYTFLLISISVFLCLAIIGKAYSWFNILTTGNDNAKSNVVENGDLSIEYTNSNEIKGENILPGWSQTKTFTVENTGTLTASYNINWANLVNEFVNKEDLVYTITSDNSGGNLVETVMPESGENINILSNIAIDPEVTQTYTLTITYKNRDADQTSDVGKRLFGKLEVIGNHSIKHTVSVNVLNGTINGNSSKEIDHKGYAMFLLEPSSGYGNPTVECTNSQNADIRENTLNVKTLTNDTTCTVTYEDIRATKIISDKYSSTNTEGLIKLDQPATTQTIALSEYRYSGSDVKNYVRFNGDESWRIVGVFKVDNGTENYDIRVKIMRNGFIGSYSWDTSPSGINDIYIWWDDATEYGGGINQWGPSGSYEGADLMRLLNPGYTNFGNINNSLYWDSKSGTCYTWANNETGACDFTSTGLKDEAKNMIDTVKWYTTGLVNSYTASQSYIAERGNVLPTHNDVGITVTRTLNWIGKVGLIYPSDYAYASKNCHNKKLSELDNTTCTSSNWMFRSNSYWATLSSNNTEKNVPFAIAGIDNSGKIPGSSFAGRREAIRPAVYLKPDVKITGGKGTSAEPYELDL